MWEMGAFLVDAVETFTKNFQSNQAHYIVNISYYIPVLKPVEYEE